MGKAPRRGLRLAKFQFLLFLLVCFLLPDVIADDLFRHTDGADAVPACPTVVAREVALPPQILPMHADRRLPFQEPHRVRHTHLRWNTPQDMHVIRPRVPFHQRHAVPLTPLPNDSPNPTSHLAEDRAFPILRHPHHMLSAIPSAVGLALPRSHDGLLSELGSSCLETVSYSSPDPYHGRTSARLTTRGGGLPI